MLNGNVETMWKRYSHFNSIANDMADQLGRTHYVSTKSMLILRKEIFMQPWEKFGKLIEWRDFLIAL
jgi:hypothetical protein